MPSVISYLRKVLCSNNFVIKSTKNICCAEKSKKIPSDHFFDIQYFFQQRKHRTRNQLNNFAIFHCHINFMRSYRFHSEVEITPRHRHLKIAIIIFSRFNYFHLPATPRFDLIMKMIWRNFHHADGSGGKTI